MNWYILSPKSSEKTPNFATFSNCSFCDGSAQCFRKKDECGCATTNVDLSIKIILQSNDIKVMFTNLLFWSATDKKHQTDSDS